MFTGINIAQSLHVCKRVLVWYPLAYLHGLKQKYFQHCDVTNCPAPPVSKTYRTVTPPVSYRTELWSLWTVTPLIYIYIYIYIWCDLGKPNTWWNFTFFCFVHSLNVTKSYGYLNLADSCDFQEWNFEKNGFKVRRVSLSLHGFNKSCLSG